MLAQQGRCLKWFSVLFQRNNSLLSYSSSCKVPKEPAWTANERKAEIPEISEELARYLERTSLVEFSSADGIRQLNEAIEFADQIQEVNTEGVEPSFSLHENE